MSDLNCHDEAPSALLAGYLTEEEAAAQRGLKVRTLRKERQRGDGPPYVKICKRILYPIDGFRAWLKTIERHPVRGPMAAAMKAPA